MKLTPNRVKAEGRPGRAGEENVVEIRSDDYTDDEAGLVERFVDEWRGQLCWFERLGVWYVWGKAEGVWVGDDESRHYWRMVTRSAMAHKLFYTSNPVPENVRAGLTIEGGGRGFDYCKTTHYRSVLESAKAYLAAEFDDFDQDPWELNTPSGVVDLRSGVLWEHETTTKKYMRRCAVTPTVDKENRVVWNPRDTPVWVSHLNDVLCANRGPDYVEYLRILAGMTLIGDQSQKKHLVPQMTGKGRNGKGVFIETLSNIIGDYGMKGSTRLLSASMEAHTTDQVDLIGKRLVYLEEVKKVNADLLKDLSGGGEHRARAIGKNNIQFKKGFTLWINNNGPMQHNDTSDGLWKRIPKIWLGAGIEEQAEIDDFPQWLVSEWPGILAWAISGCLDYQRWGLTTPEGVVEDSKAARDDADPLSEVLNEYFEKVDDFSICFKASDFRKIQTAHYKATGEEMAGGMRQVYAELRDRMGLTVSMDNRRITWICGIKLKSLTLEQVRTLGEGGYTGNFGDLQTRQN